MQEVSNKILPRPPVRGYGSHDRTGTGPSPLPVPRPDNDPSLTHPRGPGNRRGNREEPRPCYHTPEREQRASFVPVFGCVPRKPSTPGRHVRPSRSPLTRRTYLSDFRPFSLPLSPSDVPIDFLSFLHSSGHWTVSTVRVPP